MWPILFLGKSEPFILFWLYIDVYVYTYFTTVYICAIYSWTWLRSCFRYLSLKYIVLHRGVLVFQKFWHSSPEHKETWSLDATGSEVWIGNFNVKARKSTKHNLHKIWRSLKFCTNSGKQAHPRGVVVLLICVLIHGALFEWKCKNLLSEKQPKFTEMSTPQLCTFVFWMLHNWCLNTLQAWLLPSNVLILLICVQILVCKLLIAFLIALQWKCAHPLGKKQPKFFLFFANFSERQIFSEFVLLSLHALTLKLPIQLPSLSLAP